MSNHTDVESESFPLDYKQLAYEAQLFWSTLTKGMYEKPATPEQFAPSNRSIGLVIETANTVLHRIQYDSMTRTSLCLVPPNQPKQFRTDQIKTYRHNESTMPPFNNSALMVNQVPLAEYHTGQITDYPFWQAGVHTIETAHVDAWWFNLYFAQVRIIEVKEVNGAPRLFETQLWKIPENISSTYWEQGQSPTDEDIQQCAEIAKLLNEAKRSHPLLPASC